MTQAQFYLMMAARAHVHRDHQRTMGAKVLFASITDCCDDPEMGGNAKGVWTVSLTQLAKMLGSSKGAVSKWILQLERGGYITVTRPPRGINSYAVRNTQN